MDKEAVCGCLSMKILAIRPCSKQFFFLTSKQSVLKINRHTMMSATDIGDDIDSDCEGDGRLIVDNDGEQK